MTALILSVCFLGGLALAALGGHLLAARLDGEAHLDRVLVAILPPLAVLIAALYADQLLAGLFNPWNSTRLAPPAALLLGADLYPAVDQGPLLGLMYPPLAALAYLPAAALPTPEPAVVAGILLTAVYALVPVGVLLRAETNHGDHPRRRAGLALAVFTLAAFLTPSLANIAAHIHCDAPALGLLTIACWLIWGDRADDGRRVWAAALAVALAVWTKQVAVTASVAFALYLGLTRSPRDGLKFLLQAGLCAAVFGAIVLLIVDPRALFTHIVDLPRRHPWKASGLGKAAVDLALLSTPSLLLPLIYTVHQRRRSDVPWRTWLREERWPLATLIGLAAVPVSLLGYVKVGGTENSLSYSTFFLLLGSVLLVTRLAGGAPDSTLRRPARITLVLAAIGLGLALLPALTSAPRLLEAAGGNPHRTTYAFAQAHPGRVAAPSFPLATIKADGRALHALDGIYILELAGGRLEPDSLQRFLMADLEYLVVPADTQGLRKKVLPPTARALEAGTVPGFTVYVLPKQP